MNIETLAPYLLPLAMGLAGAALYHLIGPMLRITVAVLKFPLYLILRFFDYTEDIPANDRWSAWNWIYGRRPETKPADATLRFGKSDDDYAVIELVNCTDDKTPSVNVKYDGALKFVAVNQRLDALEERMGNVEEQLEPTPLRFTNPNTRFYPYAPYGAAGKPCPKPTKDLRPGDEVSIRCKIKSIYAGSGGEPTFSFDMYCSAWPTIDELEAIRTDNK